MLGPVLDTVIGLVFLFTILSAITSGIVEWGARHFRVRARLLLKAIAGLLGDKADAFWQDPLVVAAEKPGARKLPSRENARSFTVPSDVRDTLDRSREAPSYVAPRTFALAVARLYRDESEADGPASCWSRVLCCIVKCQAAPRGGDAESGRSGQADPAGPCEPRAFSLAETLVPLADAAGGDHERFLRELETWFNDTMDRVTGWYKQSLKVWLFAAGLAVAIAANADAVHVAQTLWNEETVRTAVADAGSAFVEQSLTEPTDPTTEPAPAGTCEVVAPAGPSPSPSPSLDEEASALESRINTCIQTLRDLESLGVPLGWPLEDRDSSDPRIPDDAWSWVLKVLGWLITATALSLGAPFWFDLLGKFINLRTTGAKPRKQPNEMTQ